MGRSGSQDVIGPAQLSIKIADHGKWDLHEAGPDEMTVWTVDTDRSDFEIARLKCVVGITKLCHLISASSRKVKRITGEDQGPPGLKQRLQGHFGDGIVYGGGERPIRRSIPNT
jgi:hypothetical protein